MKNRIEWTERDGREIVRVHLYQSAVNRVIQTAAGYGARDWGVRGDGGRGGMIEEPEEQGLFGEAAVSELFGVPYDDSLLEHGDEGWDFVLSNGKKVDSKCRGGETFYGNMLVNATAFGTSDRPKVMCADYYIACHLLERLDDYALVEIYGWQRAEYIKRKPLTPSYNSKGKHMNRCVYWDDLLAIRELVNIHAGVQDDIGCDPLVDTD
jgi:hypothetical protein